MPLDRSPPKQSTSTSEVRNSNNTYSNPETPAPEHVTHRHKKKQDADYNKSFESFTTKLMNTLDVWKENIQECLDRVNTNVNDVIKNDLSKLTSEIQSVRSEYNEIKSLFANMQVKYDQTLTEVDTIKEALEFNSGQHDEIRKKIDGIGKKTKNLEKIEADIEAIKIENKSLRMTLNENEQRDRLKNLEIIGIPELKDEDILTIILNISKTIGAEIRAEDIVHCNRVTPRIKKQGRPRVIVVKMRTRLIRDNFLSFARKRRVTSADINIPGSSSAIFINEHLTSYNKQLLSKAKEVSKDRKYQFVWSKNGRIYARKDDTSPYIIVMNEEDLKKFV